MHTPPMCHALIIISCCHNVAIEQLLLMSLAINIHNTLCYDTFYL